MNYEMKIELMTTDWIHNPRWKGVFRPYSPQKIVDLQGKLGLRNSFSTYGAKKFWEILNQKNASLAPKVNSENQAIEHIQKGFDFLVISKRKPSPGSYGANETPQLIRDINQSLHSRDEVNIGEGLKKTWLSPLMIDFCKPLQVTFEAFEFCKKMIGAGASGISFCESNTKDMIRSLIEARLASDILGVQTVTFAKINVGNNSAESKLKEIAPFCDVITLKGGSCELSKIEQFISLAKESYPEKKLALDLSKIKVISQEPLTKLKQLEKLGVNAFLNIPSQYMGQIHGPQRGVNDLAYKHKLDEILSNGLNDYERAYTQSHSIFQYQ